jgi:2,3-bisphosphoglycerate-dependent phosphoglycerate mutase
MSTLVLLRHGRSDWNDKNLFTGWVDSDLNAAGEEEAKASGRYLAEDGLLPDVAHTSLLKRAIRTCNLALDGCERAWVPIRRSWRLNERHYGGLQGLDKAETLEKYGQDQFMAWRRSYATPPPPIERGSKWDISDDPRYADLPPEVVPQTECLADVVVRMLPYWADGIVPDLRAGKVTLVAAHGNSLRALVKHLEQISDEDIAGLNIPTGVPWVYELGDDMMPTGERRELGDPEAIAAATAAVAAQGSKQPAVKTEGAPLHDVDEPVKG